MNKENFDKHTSRCLNILCSFCGKRQGDFDNNAKYMEHYKQHLNEYTNKILMGSRYWVKDLNNPLQGENLLRGLNHINLYNTLTRYVTIVINVNINQLVKLVY